MIAHTCSHKRARRMVGPLVVVLGALAGAALLTWRDPNTPGFWPQCPTYALFDLYCPGCGSTRAAFFLAQFNLRGALAMNPLAVLALPYLGYELARWVKRCWTGYSPPRTLAPAPVVITVAVAIIAYAVLRNLPGFEVLAPHLLS